MINPAWFSAPLLGLLISLSPNGHAESGEQLFSMLCLACHPIRHESQTDADKQPKADFSSDDPAWMKAEDELQSLPAAAPLITEVRSRYLLAYPQQQPFVDRIKAWLLKPKVDQSLLPEQLQHFELMPELGLVEDQADNVARYIYRTDFSPP